MRDTTLATLGISKKHMLWFGYEWLDDDSFDPPTLVKFGGEWMLRDDREYQLRLIEINPEFIEKENVHSSKPKANQVE